MKNTRRNFIKKAMVSGGLIPFAGDCLKLFNDSEKKISLNKNATILFQGDSITDSFRLKEEHPVNYQRSMGVGYVHNVAAYLLGKYPEKEFKVYNRGIGGNKVSQLLQRWEKDTIALKPDVLTIIIGINDYFHFKKNNISVDNYYNDYHELIKSTMEAYPNLTLIIGEPFTIDHPNVDRNKLFEFQEVAKRIASEFNAKFIPLQSIFDKALKVAPKSYWSREGDGIHPSLAGAYLISEQWLNQFKI
jgi:lysophospholipase L1-like esterase